jgi:hypothetical protein
MLKQLQKQLKTARFQMNMLICYGLDDHLNAEAAEVFAKGAENDFY